MNSKCFIALAYHKKSPIIESNYLHPVQVGKSLSDEDLGFICDNTGENISRKNIFYAEMSAIYWMWKNVDAEYLGLFHYRRILDFKNNKNEDIYNYQINEKSNIFDDLGLTDEEINKKLDEYNIITRKKQSLLEWSNFTIKEHYAHEHLLEHLELATNYINGKYPEISNHWDDFLNQSESYFSNMFVMKRDIFNEFCKFVFDILKHVEEMTNLYDRRLQYGQKQARFLGYLAERLTGYFIYSKSLQNSSEVLELPVAAITDDMNANWFEHNTYEKISTSNEDERNNFNESPKVSVLVAVYNTAKYLENSLKSVFEQTYSNIELIVVNDGSTDDSLYKLNKLKESHDFILINKKNAGLGCARNSALERSSGKYIHFMDSDDYMEPDFIKKMVSKAEENNSEIVLSTHRCFDDSNGKTLFVSTLPYNVLGVEGNTSIDLCDELMLTPCHVWDKLYLKDFLNNIKFTPFGGEDIPFFWKTITSAKKISIQKECKYNYRLNENSIQTNSKYALQVFESINIASNFIRDNYQGSNVEVYFKIFKIMLVGHILYKNRYLLENDSSFRYEYYKNIKLILGDITKTDYIPQQMYYNCDLNFMIEIKELSYFRWCLKLNIGPFKKLKSFAVPIFLKCRSLVD
ncbi:DUF4422 domain-containing protein [Vibrio gazogenes]|uniref:Glycosyltransferase 2-like domain-containing protein n=1 Tax=Vibrio gazogenes TaxID=687 RepID=A0A1Z2SFD3_VIBGA|nr:DUF4422 domain-containing protein [Vibrio gazogenes]ASA55900.1 hypothetical protein BSQ33_09485 [Vibrio gazogenes]